MSGEPEASLSRESSLPFPFSISRDPFPWKLTLSSLYGDCCTHWITYWIWDKSTHTLCAFHTSPCDYYHVISDLAAAVGWENTHKEMWISCVFQLLLPSLAAWDFHRLCVRVSVCVVVSSLKAEWADGDLRRKLPLQSTWHSPPYPSAYP